MIKLKPRPTIPATLSSASLQEYIEGLNQRVQAGDKLQSTDFDGSYWRANDVKKSLSDMHSGKCCYCERKRDEKRETDVEHFRPKACVTEEPQHLGYWWLAYNWDNYFYSCKKCNQTHKKNQFPLMLGSLRAFNPTDNIANEKPFLLNPEKDNPEDFIIYEWTKTGGLFVKAVGLDDDLRGHTTIKILGLNQGTIPAQRAEIVSILQELVETMHVATKRDPDRAVKEVAKLIKKETLAEREFAGFRRDFFRHAGLGNYIAND